MAAGLSVRTMSRFGVAEMAGAMPLEAADEPPELAAALEPRGPRRGGRVRRGFAATLAVVCLAGAAFAWVSWRHDRAASRRPRTTAAVLAPAATVVWSVVTPERALTAVVAASVGRRAAAVVIPPATSLELPGMGPVTAGDVSTPGPLAVDMAQAVLGRRVSHSLVTQDLALGSFVDAVGGVTIEVEDPFSDGARVFGAGPQRLDGAGVIAYLRDDDTARATSRWEDVLQGLFAARISAHAWSGVYGVSDDAAAVGHVLALAHGANVQEVPTTVGVDGSTRVDHRKLGPFVAKALGPVATPLVRVVVLNGDGRPGEAARFAPELAVAGLEVVVAQNATRFNVHETEILAASPTFLGAAETAQRLIGVGKVYVDPQPTGIADVTIVSGKDLASG